MNTLFRLLLSLLLILIASPAWADEAAWEQLRNSAIVIFRHANAPGVGDPPGLVIGDCATQRNLDDKGRAQARAIGETFRSKGIAVGEVLTSQWCRARETAELAFPGQVKEEPAFNSFFGDRAAEPEQTARARRILLGWKGPGVLVVVSHQVNIAALTGIAPKSGEGVLLVQQSGALQAIGRVKAED